MPPASTLLDVIVCTKDRPDDLARCLASLAGQTEPASAVVVVDAGEGERSWLRDDLPLTVIESEAGLPRQRNAGLDATDSDLVAFLDDDVELEPEYLARVRAFLASHPAAVGVGGHITNDEPRARASTAYRSLFSLGNDDGVLRPSGDAVYLYHPDRPTRVDLISGSNMVFRRSGVEGLRFDEQLAGYAYMEDVDFCLRAGERGELWTIPDARLVHHKTTTARVPPRAYVRQVLGNGAYLFSKHRVRRGLRRGAYARRVIGRSGAYLALAVARRSPEPALGVAQGLAAIPKMLALGARRANR